MQSGEGLCVGGVIVSGAPHATEQGDLQRTGKAQVGAQVGGFCAAGAELQSDAEFGGQRADRRQFFVAGGFDGQIVADLEDGHTQCRRIPEHVGERHGLGSSLGETPEVGVGAQANCHGSAFVVLVVGGGGL